MGWRMATTVAAALLTGVAAAPAQQRPATDLPPPATYGTGQKPTNRPIPSSLLFDDRSTITESYFGADGHMFVFRKPIQSPFAFSGSCSNKSGPSLMLEGVQTRQPPGEGPLGLYVQDGPNRSIFQLNDGTSIGGVYSLVATGVPEFVRSLEGLPYGRIVILGLIRGNETVPFARYVATGATTAHQIVYGGPPQTLDFLRTVDSYCQSLMRR